jgi:hypothetical protein
MVTQLLKNIAVIGGTARSGYSSAVLNCRCRRRKAGLPFIDEGIR